MIKKDEKTALKKVSYRVKDATICPICSVPHYREELLSGGGRLIAGNLTREFRRLYKPSAKYGVVYPLAFGVQVCPQCLYSAYPKDFKSLSQEEAAKIRQTKDHRAKSIKVIFGAGGQVNFEEGRNLISGLASYILAVDCYHFRESSTAPTAKTAISCLRASWLFDDLSKLVSYRPYDEARDFYYNQAAKYYAKTLEYMQSGKESADSVTYMLGPDTDHNWGYEGVLYLSSYLLRRKTNLSSDMDEKKIKSLEKAKKYLSKIYGTGKASRAKPGPMVSMSKDLFDDITKEIQGYQTEV